jgi:hypothetical protein
MSVLTAFYQLMDPIFAGRAYRGTAGDSPVAPYATFFRVVAVEGVTLDKNGGDDNETATEIQLDVYAMGGDELDTLVGTVKHALKAWTVTNVITSEGDTFEQDTKLYRTMLTIATIQ